MKIKDMPDVLTRKEVADFFRVTRLTIYRWDKKGDLPGIQISDRGNARYLKKDVLKYLNR